MPQSVVNYIVLIALTSIVTGCKLAAMVSSGGDITSLSGTRNCTGPGFCEFEITNSNFSESFTANPKPGYEFVKWHGGAGFLCGDSTDPTCVVALSGDALSAAIISFFDMYHIMPVFKDVGIDSDGDGIRDELDEDDDNDGILDVDDTCPKDPSPGCTNGVPVTDTVQLNGRTWAQVDLFTSLSWNEIQAVCPGGPCSGTLNGLNMAGWTWASRADITALFDFYVCGPSAAGCFDGHEVSSNTTWAPQMFIDGMRPTQDVDLSRSIAAIVADINTADPEFTHWTYWVDGKPATTNDRATATSSAVSIDFKAAYQGAWFYAND